MSEVLKKVVAIDEANDENHIGYKICRIGDVVKKITGGCSTKKTDYINSGVLVLNKGHIKEYGIVDLGKKERFVSSEYASNNPLKIVKKETVLVTLRDLSVKADFLGLIGTYKKTEDAIITQGMYALDLEENVYAPYLVYFSNSPSYRVHVKLNKIGSTQVHLRNGQFLNIEIPLPSVEQQKRIVAKVEELFSYIDAGIVALQKAKQLLKQYRQSVLKAAVTGELTKEWREANKNKLEPASQLLEHILKERRQKWEEQQLKQFQAKGKTPKDDKWKGKYKEPVVVESLPFEIPNEWKTISLDTFIFNIEAGKSFKCDERPPLEGETGIVKVSAVTWGEFHSEESKTITDRKKINPNYRIKEGDFLFSRANTIELIGACVIVKNVDKDLLLSDKIHRFIIPDEWKEWVRLCLRTRHGRNEIESLATGNQDSMRNISQGNVKSIRVPLLSIVELKLLISRFNQKIDAIQRLESEIEIQLIKANKNKQSILASAFSGSLKGTINEY